MAELECSRCDQAGEGVAGHGPCAPCPCLAGVWPATEGTGCVDCGVDFQRGDVCLRVALTRLTGRPMVLLAQCLGCAAYEQVVGARYRQQPAHGATR
jgi:hypothetical protein